MLDRTDRAVPRFPASAQASVRERINGWLAAHPVRMALCGATCGSDLIFAEAAAASGVETHLVLPFAAGEFVDISVAHGGREWVRRFERAISAADSVTVINDEVADAEGSVFDFSNRMVAAKGLLLADSLGLHVRGLAVWNGLRGDGGGGTADAISCWIKAKIPVHVIHPLDPVADGPAGAETALPCVPFAGIHTAKPEGARGVVGFLAHFHFADYPKFPEALFPKFQKSVLDPLAAILADAGPVVRGRYGFGADYVFAFDSARAALPTASRALEALAGHGEGFALPSVCLHVGPVQLMVNPVLNQYCHEGGAVSRVARAARRLPAGRLFCTEAFAALSALEAVRHFRFMPCDEMSGGDDPTPDRMFAVVAADQS